MRLAIKHPRLT